MNQPASTSNSRYLPRRSTREHLARLERRRKILGDGPAQHRGAHVDAPDAAARDEGFDAATGNLDFWQLWHGFVVCGWLGAMVRVL